MINKNITSIIDLNWEEYEDDGQNKQVDKWCEKLEMSDKSVRYVKYLMEKAIEHKAIKSKKAIEGGCIYIIGIMTDERQTQQEIADATGLKLWDIRKRYTEICNGLQLEIIL